MSEPQVLDLSPQAILARKFGEMAIGVDFLKKQFPSAIIGAPPKVMDCLAMAAADGEKIIRALDMAGGKLREAMQNERKAKSAGRTSEKVARRSDLRRNLQCGNLVH